MWDILGIAKQMKIEPFMFMALLSWFLNAATGPQLTQERICLVGMQPPSSTCFNVTSSGTFTQYANVGALIGFLNLLVPLVTIPVFTKVVQMSLPVMGFTGSLFWVAALLVKGLSPTETGLYISQVWNIMSSTSVTAF
ncbi:hypothetical protein HDE_13966 [Halotydeus destructor]|nr:hypothetical protein HDE_13966 [Halotydeus destructor]